MEYLTHKFVERQFMYFMVGRGWTRVRGKKNNFNHIYPDGIYKKDDNQGTIVAEIKPENKKLHEILKGIGQCARYLPYNNVAPYLIIPLEWFNHIQDTFQYLPWLGIVTYTNAGVDMEIKQRSNRCMI